MGQGLKSIDRVNAGSHRFWTREADLFAPTGTHNYWPTEVVTYVQGSDHDVFLGLGVPATMLGHDPDWTHHTSEDTVDKTDATEFRRVGVLAAAAAYWSATDASRQKQQMLRLGYLTAADTIAGRAQRVAQILAGPNSARARKRLQDNWRVLADLLNQQQNYLDGFLEERPPAPPEGMASEIKSAKVGGKGLRRLTLIPVDASAFESLAGDDRKWWDDQREQFAGDNPGGGLPTGPTFDLVAYEAINFMDGRRTAADIADLLGVEFNRDFDAAWVERLVGILEKLSLVKAN